MTPRHAADATEVAVLHDMQTIAAQHPHRRLTVREISSRTALPYDVTRRALARLVASGHVLAEGNTRGRRYTLSASGAA